MAHEITVLHIASRHTYGVPRIHAELRRLGHRVNHWGCPRVRGRGNGSCASVASPGSPGAGAGA
ncbi:IS3 family transposase [Streptomyces minutiscleroticus]|uniref:IS3 family transposase n=1 Tax=Streptomyces minutiscleroticus TaxID=68238 RepID=UPI0035711562